MTRSLRASFLVGCALLSWTSCVVRTRDLCDRDAAERVGTAAPRDCHRCEDDGECVFLGNVCEGVVYCAHEAATLTSTSVGCSPEPSAPDDADCVCRDGYCQVR